LRYNTFLKSSIDSGKICSAKLEDNTEHSMWMYSVLIPNRTYSDIETYMKLHNIEIRPLFYDIRSHPYLTNIMNIHDTEEIRQVQTSGCMLPSYPELTEAQQKYICETLIGFINT
jgi:dTDP-4-amino-4,6-dideoxygalactose transaminase